MIAVEEAFKDELPAAEDIKAPSPTTPTMNTFAAFGKKITMSL
jgi:hypothetical protein